MFIKGIILLSCFLALCACGTAAQARFPRGSAAATCAYATDNGCAAANQNGSFQSASLLTSAQQSGQNSLLPSHPMTFNIPGVDYPIGPDKTLTPKDPRTINDGVCAYTGTPPNDFVACAASGVQHEVLDNYDFCGTKISKSLLGIYLNNNASAGSTVTFTNDYFCIPPGPDGNKAIGFNGPSAGNWSVIFKNSQCDGSTAIITASFCFDEDSGEASATTFDVEYSAFTNQGQGRIVGGLRSTAITFKYNLIQGMQDLMTPNHGEVSLRTCAQNNCTGSETYEGNFIIVNAVPDDFTGNGIFNAMFFPSTGDSNQLRLSAVNMVNNIIVTNNFSNDGEARVGKVLFNLRAATSGAVTITGNWLDGTGAHFCGVNGQAQNGGNTASTSGNTITITATVGIAPQNAIEPGYLIVNPGFTTAAITAFGTGAGDTGTYTFDGAPQTQGSTSTWTIVPGFTSATLTPNWNLADPSHTGTPTAVGFSGPTMQEATCLGVH